jgi:N-acetylglucosaminylphosphatidylinositol deacetylase
MTQMSPNPRKLNVFVIAHPDDESMFFIPTIRALQQHESESTIWLLCLTTGDYDGLGKARVKELEKASYDVLGIDRVIQLNELKDHPTESWSIDQATQCLRACLRQEIDNDAQKYSKICIFTFDQDGVSGHINHRDTFLAVRQLYLEEQENGFSSTERDLSLPAKLMVFLLETEPSLFQKYFPVYEWLSLILFWIHLVPQISPLKYDGPSHVKELIFRLRYPCLNWRAMATHRSQFVWYRRLFVVFSCYTYVNRLKNLGPDLPKAKQLVRT